MERRDEQSHVDAPLFGGPDGQQDQIRAQLSAEIRSQRKESERKWEQTHIVRWDGSWQGRHLNKNTTLNCKLRRQPGRAAQVGPRHHYVTEPSQTATFFILVNVFCVWLRKVHFARQRGVNNTPKNVSKDGPQNVQVVDVVSVALKKGKVARMTWWNDFDYPTLNQKSAESVRSELRCVWKLQRWKSVRGSGYLCTSSFRFFSWTNDLCITAWQRYFEHIFFPQTTQDFLSAVPHLWQLSASDSTHCGLLLQTGPGHFRKLCCRRSMLK